ncbi:SOS response-associated peptidase family protein [Agarivorans aestuarii]|uniref:Abasic site processing protein n=1 Tax=Agarivorans aestuarii TaxID=1563703 RepID=A0ABU7GAN2_9ALTE|nr:SOS response-associated peptidase family protein [Agarivorans aestuarii]MEE1675520.1 SOS response-associated peptidase family protein [Agarivorans aestuarii]
MCGSVMIGGEYEIRQAIGVDSLFLDFGETKQYRPSESLPALIVEQNALRCKPFIWGVKHPQHSQLIINARAETAADKPMFKDAWKTQRCLLPVKAWHEWRNQERFEFSLEHQNLLLLGGLYLQTNTEQQHLVVLTQAAASYLQQYHHRMPLLFELKQGLSWLSGEHCDYKAEQFHYHVSSNSPQLGLF